MIIKVTAEHIKNGQPRNNCACPIALAVDEQMKVKSVVTTYAIFISNTRYVLPDAAKAFISAFDSLEQVEPFEFELYENTSN